MGTETKMKEKSKGNPVLQALREINNTINSFRTLAIGTDKYLRLGTTTTNSLSCQKKIKLKFLRQNSFLKQDFFNSKVGIMFLFRLS